MIRNIAVPFTLCVSLFVVACDVGGDPENDFRSGDDEFEAEASFHAALDGPFIDDAKMEFEVEDGLLHYKYESEGLPPGEVVTVWLGGFNQPDNCVGTGPLADGSGQCGLTDWISPNTYASTQIMWKNAGSAVIGPDGELEFEGIDDPNVPTEFGPQLDVETAEIQIWVRTHGLPIPGRLDEQLSHSQGGCDVNTCVDLQIAVIPAS